MYLSLEGARLLVLHCQGRFCVWKTPQRPFLFHAPVPPVAALIVAQYWPALLQFCCGESHSAAASCDDGNFSLKSRVTVRRARF
jgi:hypothetical protein